MLRRQCGKVGSSAVLLMSRQTSDQPSSRSFKRLLIIKTCAGEPQAKRSPITSEDASCRRISKLMSSMRSFNVTL